MMDTPSFVHLFDPFQLGPLSLKNRIAFAPIMTGHDISAASYRPLIDFYLDRVKNHGPGLVTIGGIGIHPLGKRHPLDPSPTLFSWKNARLLADELHQQGTKLLAQLIHHGLDVAHPLPFGASRVYHPDKEIRTLRLPSFYIPLLIKYYVQHAKRAVTLGNFDGVEVYAGNRSLPHTFTSPALNRRRDKWGLNHGFYFVEKLVNDIRAGIGNDKALTYRISLMDLTPSGQTFDQLVLMGQLLQKNGVNGFCFEIGLSPNQVPVACELTPAGVWLPFMEAFAREMSVPVIYGKKLPDAKETNKWLGEHPNSLAEFARPLIADPQWAQKVYENKLDTIVPCVECPQRCVSQTLIKPQQIYCISQPEAMDRESELLRESFPMHRPRPNNGETTSDEQESTRQYEPYEFPDVLVVGGGPAGMAAARQAALDGYKVTLVDQHPQLGGLYRLSGMVPGRDQVNELLSQQTKILQDLGVQIILNTKVDLPWIEDHAPNSEIILATGTQSKMLDIPGVDSPNVYTFDELLTTTWVRPNHVAIIGRNTLALDIARFFCPKKNNNPQAWLQAWGIANPIDHQGGVKGVVPKLFTTVRSIYLLLTTSLNDFEMDLRAARRHYELRWLRMNGVRTFSNVEVTQIDNHFVRCARVEDKDLPPIQQTGVIVLPEGFEAGDDLMVVLADGLEPRLELAESLTKADRGFYLAGSLKHEERLWGAGLSAYDGMMVARDIKEKDIAWG